ncbi:hypothetical protein HYW20_01700 [Candidatus Woesearchaeota archaeon]|nr:hypothetical protein [Candidatus Woesearchaeota archaeon]
MMNLIHRFGQLLIIFIVSFFAALSFFHYEKIFDLIKTIGVYNIRKKYYKASKIYLYIDLAAVFTIFYSFILIRSKILWGILVFVLAMHYLWFDIIKFTKARKDTYLLLDILAFALYLSIFKITDLVLRGRLIVNMTRILDKYLFQITIIGGVFIVIVISLVYIIFKKFKNFNKLLKFIENKSFEIIKHRPQKIISFFLLLVMLFFLSRNFTGDNFYKFGFEHYTDSFIAKGTSPWVIMINFIFNLNNNVTILIYFAFIGIVYIFLKDNKNFYEYFLIFVIIGFSQFLLDWEYIRLYIIPIYAVFIGIGLTFVVKNASARFNKNTIYAVLVSILILHLIITNVFIQREFLLPKLNIVKERLPLAEKYYIQAGEYLKNKGDFSIHTSSSIDYDSKTAYYAGKYNSVLAQSILTEDKKYDIVKISFSKIVDTFKRGQKIGEIYNLKDPIFGSYYYHGRYIFNLNIREINNKDSIKIIGLYKIKYIVDSPESKKKTEFFDSMQHMKNKVYSSGQLYVYDLSKGK